MTTKQPEQYSYVLITNPDILAPELRSMVPLYARVLIDPASEGGMIGVGILGSTIEYGYGDLDEALTVCKAVVPENAVIPLRRESTEKSPEEGEQKHYYMSNPSL